MHSCVLTDTGEVTPLYIGHSLSIMLCSQHGLWTCHQHLLSAFEEE